MDNVGAVPESNDAPTEGQQAPVVDDGAPKTPEAKAPVTPPVTPSKKAYKFKVDDQEVTEEYTDEEVLKHLQKSKGADKRFQEAATIKQQTERLYQLLKENPFDVLEKIHGDRTRQMMEERLWAKIQREQMDPQARELLETKERLQALEAEKKSFAEKQQKDEFTRLKLQHAQNFDKEIRDALQAAGKTVTPYAFKRVAHYMLSAMNENRQLSAKDAVPMMDQDLQADLKAMFESTTEDNILQLLGDPTLEKVRKADLKRVRSGYTPTAPTPPGKKDDKKPDAREFEKRTSLFDWE